MTTAEDIDRQNYDRIALPLISKLSGKVSQRLRSDSVRGSTICVMVKTGEFQNCKEQHGCKA